MSIQLPEGITQETVNGLEAYRVDIPAARGLVYAQGAHVAQWAPAGADEVLWLSDEAVYAPGKAIRGGVPICWPWFGPGRDGRHSPAHGFARTSSWRLVAAEVVDEVAVLGFELRGDDVAATGSFPRDFTVRLEVRMGAELELALTTDAHGAAFEVEEALHTYLSVADVHRVRVEGLEQASYLDKLDGDEKVQQGPVEFTSETDRIYHSDGTATLVDEVAGRRVVVAKEGSADTVVWNPWVDKSAAMADFGDDEWTGMCCVETVNALDNAVRVEPGHPHTMTVRLSLD